jgi:hypothetical protein
MRASGLFLFDQFYLTSLSRCRRNLRAFAAVRRIGQRRRGESATSRGAPGPSRHNGHLGDSAAVSFGEHTES